ncbi:MULTISPECIES: hypothetical protein [Acetobacter]|nr:MULTISPECIES: hypothetical protein [Acetobacter]KAA8394276.1 hypothetical protein FKW22_10625 [Acetobacter sp. DmW_125124]KAA8394685.1 hypothetical protein FKW19_12060 [Acetobacter sp. DmW_125128]KAA8397353.1 hypothetical protein FKW20_09670 [Acetobacter sp. DmW_125127]KAA8401795.1 hypothetical protein FKW24_14375 [Acetobacter sp. DmW_125134]KAA8402620.1 hypothetical protein FKW32_13235 [Acetobacter sp. DmW_125132]
MIELPARADTPETMQTDPELPLTPHAGRSSSLEPVSKVDFRLRPATQPRYDHHKVAGDIGEQHPHYFFLPRGGSHPAVIYYISSR